MRQVAFSQDWIPFPRALEPQSNDQGIMKAMNIDFGHNYKKHVLLILNRGEIAARIVKTARNLGLKTVVVYTPSDVLAEYVGIADTAVPLRIPSSPNSTKAKTSTSEGTAYLDIQSILDIIISPQYNITLVHPGYGFLSENADFARAVEELVPPVTWLGPRSELIRKMGLKHIARDIVRTIEGVEVSPGSEGLVSCVDDVIEVVKTKKLMDGADGNGAVLLKPSAGGGGLGMVVCRSLKEVEDKFEGVKERAKVLFGNDGIFLEKYIEQARHVEVQIFGDGKGNVVHLGERECSVQRRNQKIIEETPSPFLNGSKNQTKGLRQKIWDAAVRICSLIKYDSVGTVEFLVDDISGAFYFLEMNTRIQVEHPITEMVYNEIDLIELMITFGIAKHDRLDFPKKLLQQGTYDQIRKDTLDAGRGCAIEARVYAENPSDGFTPSSGLLQFVDLCEAKYDWLRVDTWVSTGIQVTTHYDPLLCKIIVYGSTREEARERLTRALEECKVLGAPNNIRYLRAILQSKDFKEGSVTTRFLDTFEFNPRVIKVLTSSIEMTVQDLPGRIIGKGIPRSGPMDPLAFKIGNLLVGNDESIEGIEIVIFTGSLCSFQFSCPSVIAITGMEVEVKVNGVNVLMWSCLVVPKGGRVQIKAINNNIEGKGGMRVYLLVKGGFPDIPKYLGSKSTSMGFGGYQGRSLLPGDTLFLGTCDPTHNVVNSDIDHSICRNLIPTYPIHWTIFVLSGPHDDEEFLTQDGISKFYDTHWHVSPSSNRMGIRLESSNKIEWANDGGGEGGAHPSNILDNGYALGSVNLNGDTPVILTNEGPDMGGYLCLCTIVSTDLWKLGQLRSGCTVQFQRISYTAAIELGSQQADWLLSLSKLLQNPEPFGIQGFPSGSSEENVVHSSILFQRPASKLKERFVLRQAGDSAILVEFGSMSLDFVIRARIQALMIELQRSSTPGLLELCPCIRSLMCHYDNTTISQSELVTILTVVEAKLPVDVTKMTFSGRRITLPIVLDDPWCKEATTRYMQSIRNKAIYLPSNIEYLAKNNGLNEAKEALDRLIGSDWVVFGVGFYLACPFLVPLRPQNRLIGQKLNPSRTWTPRGAVGIAGPVTAIYPVDSPGGYQLFGRTLPAWQTWGKGANFSLDKPWLLEAFDQIHFEPIDEQKYLELEKSFDQGRYSFKIEPIVLSMEKYALLVENSLKETAIFRQQQKLASNEQANIERQLLIEWERSLKVHSEIQASSKDANDIDTTLDTMISTLHASILRINCEIGDKIVSVDNALVVLEAMKTEIPLQPDQDLVGKRVKGFGRGVAEKAFVKPGDILIYIGP